MKKIKGWYLPQNDDHFEQYITDKGYQEVHREAILDFVKKNSKKMSCALDIGAHVGFWLADMCKEFEKVYAFEPIESVRLCLQNNVQAENYQIYPYGLSNSTGTKYVTYNEYETGNTFISDIGKTPIHVYKMDELDLPEMQYIKIDAEGHELEVCRGGRETILKHKPFVHVEAKEKILRRHNLGVPDVVDFFNDVLDYKQVFKIKSEIVFGPK